MIPAHSRKCVGASLIGFVAFLVAFTPAAFSANLQLTSETILQSFERDLPGDNAQKALPIYEYLQLDYSPGQNAALSFHGYGWMRANLGDDYFDDTTAGELLYGYLEYEPESRDFLVRAGRFLVFEGVSNETVDGVYGRAHLPANFAVSAYAGQPAALDDVNGRSGDYVVGGRVSHGRIGRYEAGLSFKALANDGGSDEQFGGFDLSVYLPWRISLQGASSYNFDTSGWAEHFYELRIPLGAVEFRPFYQKFNYDDFFVEEDSASFPFRFLAGTGNSIETLGTEAFVYVTERLELAGRYKHYQYDQRFDDADFYSLIATWKIQILSQVGVELGRMDGSEKENRYTLARAFFYWDLRNWFLTADTVWVDYDEPIYQEDRSLFASFGFGRGFFNQRLKLKFSFDFTDDPYLDSNYRTTLTAYYRYER